MFFEICFAILIIHKLFPWDIGSCELPQKMDKQSMNRKVDEGNNNICYFKSYVKNSLTNLFME